MGRGARPQRNEKGGAGNGRMAEYSSRTSAPSVAATESPSLGVAGPETRNQKPGIALIQNYLDAARMDTQGAFAARFEAMQLANIIFISIAHRRVTIARRQFEFKLLRLLDRVKRGQIDSAGIR